MPERNQRTSLEDTLLELLERVIEHAIKAGRKGDAPFAAAVVAPNLEFVIAHNTTRTTFDPTAHAEVQAIRLACEQWQRHTLDDCILLSSAEPCPMCGAAVYWSGIKDVRFVVPRSVSATFGYADEHIGLELGQPSASNDVRFVQVAVSPGVTDLMVLMAADTPPFGPDTFPKRRR